jgi:hypothetical protein
MSSLKQILASTFLTFSLLVKADYSSGGGSGSYGGGYSDDSGSSSGYGSGGSSNNYGYSNQGNEGSSTSTSSWGDGYGGGGMGGGGGYTDSWDQSSTALLETITYTMTETYMATTTVTESCSAAGSWPSSSSESWSGSSWSGSSWSGSQPSSVSVQVVHVSDNNGTLAYSPENIVAEPGSIVEFIFYPKVHSSLCSMHSYANTPQNHTVTQSSFAVPCVPIGISTPNATTPEAPGIESGFVPVAANDTSFMAGIRSSFSFMVHHIIIPILPLPHTNTHPGQRHQTNLALLQPTWPLPKRHVHGNQPEHERPNPHARKLPDRRRPASYRERHHNAASRCATGGPTVVWQHVNEHLHGRFPPSSGDERCATVAAACGCHNE